MTIYNATAAFTGADQHCQDETTVYWFDVESEDYRIEPGEYGIADCNGDLTPLDSDGAPIDYNDLLAGAVTAVCQVTNEIRQETAQ